MTRTRLSNTRLGILAVALTGVFVLLPARVAALVSGRSYGDEQHLRDRVIPAFVDYWDQGQRRLTPELADLVGYWRWYHAVKAAAAIGLLVVLVVLAARLLRAFARTGPQDRAWTSATGGTVVSALAVVAFVAALANIQAMFAPFSSLMSMLPVAEADGDLATMSGQVRHQLASYPSGSSGALRMMVHDLAVYHVVVAAVSWPAALAMCIAALASVRRFARTPRADRRARRLFVLLGLGSLLMVAALVVLAVANTTAAVDSPTAVLNFYKGSF